MLYIKIQSQSFLGSVDLKVFLLYIGMAAILFNGSKLFEQIVNTLFDRKPHVKSGKNCSSNFRDEDI